MPSDDNSDTASSGELPEITVDASGCTDNNHGDRQQEVNQELSSWTTAFHCQCPICQRHHLDDRDNPAPSHAPSAPTDVHKQTQKRPCVHDVAPTSGSTSAKRPRTGTTSHKFCGSAHCDAPGAEGRNFWDYYGAYSGTYIPPAFHAKATAAAPKSLATHTDYYYPPPLLDTWHYPRFSMPLADRGAFDSDRPFMPVPNKTVSNTHLDSREHDIVLEGIRSYPHDSADSESCHYVSSANEHMFRDRSAFETYQPLYSGRARACDQGFCQNVSFAIGRGTVRVKGYCGDRTSTIRLTEVLHVPHTRYNIISGVLLDRAGVTATMGNGCINLSFEGANIADGKIRDDFFCLNMSVIHTSNAQPRFQQPCFATTTPRGALASMTRGFTLADGRQE